MAESFWLEEPAEPLPRRQLTTPPDAVVIGGGVTGCSCALALGRGGLRVRLREARRIATGASGRNGGFALRGSALPYAVARGVLGDEDAQSLWRLTERALDRMAALAGDALRRTGSVRLAADREEREAVRADYEALIEDGFAAEWRDELDPPLDGLFLGALIHPTDGSLQPARWVRRLARLAVEAGVEIREESPVESLDEVEAPIAVIATDGYTHGLLPALDAAVRPTRGQILVSEPLDQLLFPRPHYARQGFDYWQQTPDRRLVIGGRRDTDLDAEFTSEEATTNVIQERIELFVRELLGFAPAVTHRWAGLFGSTEDRLPLVGPVPDREGVWVACGYSGHGNVLGFACGQLVAQAILGRPARELRFFDASRVLYSST